MRRVWRVAIVLLALAAGASAQPPRSARGTGGVPPTALTRAQLAQQLFREGSVEDALELYREIDAAHPGVTRIVQGIRSCLLELKRYDELREHLEADLTLHPNNPSVLEELGTVAARTGDRDAATGHWRAILAIQPGSHGAYSHVADLFMRHRMLDEAMAVYREAEKAHPGRFVRRIGNLHEVRMEFAAATHAYLDFLLMNPSTLSFVEGRLLRIGESEEGLGRVIARVDSAFAASSGAEHSPGARIALRKLLADLHLEAGDHARARDRYFDLVDALPGQLPTLLVFGRRCMADERFEV
ncbi:MAG: tetratricopeptide repeat protein, partial [Gemmatimonadota bacterium]|nr:tetratricopeptide repeat protein [Gemmatimonadota bacterium]